MVKVMILWHYTQLPGILPVPDGHLSSKLHGESNDIIMLDARLVQLAFPSNNKRGHFVRH